MRRVALDMDPRDIGSTRCDRRLPLCVIASLCLTVLPALGYLAFRRGSRGLFGDENRAIFTGVFGGSEVVLRPIAAQDCSFSAFAYTDDPALKGPGWISFNVGSRQGNPRLSSKYHKLQAYQMAQLREVDCAIWIDGCVEIASGSFVREICDALESSDAPLLVYDNPARNGSLFEEVAAVLRSGVVEQLDARYQPRMRRRMWRQYHSYLRAGFRDGGFYDNATGRRLGVYQTTVMAWNPKHKWAVSLMDAWWNDLLQHATVARDEVSLPFVLWSMRVQAAVPWAVEEVFAKRENGFVRYRGYPGWVAYAHRKRG